MSKCITCLKAMEDTDDLFVNAECDECNERYNSTQVGMDYRNILDKEEIKRLKASNEKANALLVKIFEQDRFNEDYFDLDLINEVRIHIENN